MAAELSRRQAAAGVALTTFALSARAAAPAPSPIAATRHGAVRGYVDDGVLAFLGVRYGEDTTSRRFQPPRPPAAWSGVAEATTYGAASPQRGRLAEPMSEDCLFLNVWTPALTGTRPVMVYVHGGAYATGSGSSPLYDGVRLCRRGDVVVVTLNHRLNAFGYAYLARLAPGLADSGNVGQLDLVLALRWVQANIRAFGGDPGRVMVFGQSGGGAKLATLMATPAAGGLFHRVATMSGQQVTASGPGNAHRRTLAWLDALKVGPEQAAEILPSLPAERLVEGLAAEDPVLGFGGLYFGPVLDERTLERHPFYPDAPAQSANIPMIIGNTRDETRAFLGGDPTNFTLSWDELPARLTPANLRVDIDPATVVAAYRQLYPAYAPSDVLFAATTAARSWRGALIEAEARAAAGTPAYAYQLDYPAAGDRLRAAHASDIQLVFDNLAKPGATASGPAAQRVADAMSEAFLAFARTGRPDGRGLPRWTPYTPPQRRTMIFDVHPRLAEDPRGAERRLFEKVPFVQAGT